MATIEIPSLESRDNFKDGLTQDNTGAGTQERSERLLDLSRFSRLVGATRISPVRIMPRDGNDGIETVLSYQSPDSHERRRQLAARVASKATQRRYQRGC